MSDTATTTETAPSEQAINTINELPATTASDAAGTTQASLGQRVGAYLIDIGVMMGLVIVVSLTVGMILPKLGSLLSFVGMAYILLRDCLPFLGGQSIGKKLLGLRAVATDGSSLSGNWGPGMIRNAVLFIPFFPLVELIILITKQSAPEGLLRLGDQWAGTKVIVDK